MHTLIPTIGLWYQDKSQQMTFEVVALDDAAKTIEVQFIDGELAEFDTDAWNTMLLDNIEVPEDWRNAYELCTEDYPDPDAPLHPENWDGPIINIETDIINGISDNEGHNKPY